MCTATYLGTGGSAASLLYFVVVSVLGMYIVLSLFVSILLEQFAVQDDSEGSANSEDLVSQVECPIACWARMVDHDAC